MAIGVVNSSIIRYDITSKVSELSIAAHYFGITNIPCVINSPLRKDANPSFGLFSNNGVTVHWKDFATNQSGGLFDLLMLMWHCTYTDALTRVHNEVCADREISVKIQAGGHRVHHNSAIKLECKIREWRDYDIQYWESYGIELKWLKYAEVYPISHKIIIKDNKRSVFAAEKYAYAFVEHKENNTSIKVYQPYSKRYKWANGHNGSVVSLWSKIPQKGKSLIICSSIKDALCVSCQLHIPTLAVQGEGYDMSDTAIANLKERFERIYVCFDVDAPGLVNTDRLAKRTGFIPVKPDLGNTKDFSDYYKSLDVKEDFQKLRGLFE